MSKFIYTALLLLGWFQAQAQSSTPWTDFEPSVHPVAMDMDNQPAVRVVSDYVLIKALRASMPTTGTVKSVSCTSDGTTRFLVFETLPAQGTSFPVFINIPLLRSPQGMYYVGSNAVSCSGCGNCAGCRCEGSGSGSSSCQVAPQASRSAPLALARVSTNIESQN
jgi:hypothetical protein